MAELLSQKVHILVFLYIRIVNTIISTFFKGCDCIIAKLEAKAKP